MGRERCQAVGLSSDGDGLEQADDALDQNARLYVMDYFTVLWDDVHSTRTHKTKNDAVDACPPAAPPPISKKSLVLLS